MSFRFGFTSNTHLRQQPVHILKSMERQSNLVNSMVLLKNLYLDTSAILAMKELTYKIVMMHFHTEKCQKIKSCYI